MKTVSSLLKSSFVFMCFLLSTSVYAATAGSALGSDTDSSLAVTLGDVDGDGDLDLVAGNDGQTNKLYLNDGSGDFAATCTALGSEMEFMPHVPVR